MIFKYTPSGVCAKKIALEITDDIINSVEVVGGCEGNRKAVAALLKGMFVDDAIERLEGITCGAKSTSCPDQIAKALKTYKGEDETECELCKVNV